VSPNSLAPALLLEILKLYVRITELLRGDGGIKIVTVPISVVKAINLNFLDNFLFVLKVLKRYFSLVLSLVCLFLNLQRK